MHADGSRNVNGVWYIYGYWSNVSERNVDGVMTVLYSTSFNYWRITVLNSYAIPIYLDWQTNELA